jgi:CheY-like chemotaxis protein
VETAGPADAPAGTATVLVIDDDPDTRDLMRRMLAKEGYRVLEASDGEAGLEIARAAIPDVITLDVLMPGMDGWTVLSQLKTDPRLAAIPVVMLTITDERNLGFSLGASEYLTKPIERSRLQSVLARYRKEPGAPVLVVEDDEATRTTLRRALEKDGWEVTEAENGRQGLTQLDARRPGLVLLDLMMPEMDGFEFLEALRLRPAEGCPPVVVITAKELTEDDRQRLNGGVSRVLRKGTAAPNAIVSEVKHLLMGAAAR